jgi:hypothetical protein
MDNRRIFAKFTGPEILLEQGRLLFSLLHALTRGGYSISLLDNHAPGELGKYGAYVHQLREVSLASAPPEDSRGWIYLHDQPDRSTAKRPWRAQWRVGYDLFSPYWFSAPIIMPFPMHPQQAATTSDKLGRLRLGERRMRIFFSGDSKGYSRKRIHYPKPKLPRLEVIQTVLGGLGEDVIVLKDPAQLKAPGCLEYSHKCVIADPEGAWIAPDDWLSTLAMSDFFLSPPGIVMPMCHNIVEAMAVGTVPITNYPEWFSPPLEHMRNCIVFDGKDDLIAKVRLAIGLPVEELAKLKQQAIDYYETQLRPEVFVQKVEARSESKLTLLLYTERNTALHARRLGRNSVLFRDSSSAKTRGWRGLLMAAAGRRVAASSCIRG